MGTPPRLPAALRPLATPDYRLLAAALAASLLGAGAWTVTVAWHVVASGGGPADLALVTGLLFVGILGAVVVGGAVADAVPQRRVLLAVSAIKAVVALAVTGLAASGALEVWHLATAAVVLGAADGFFFPAYSALLPRIIAARELLAANGIEGVLRPVAMMAAGPVAAGAALGLGSTAWAFAVVAVANVGGFAILLPMRVPQTAAPHAGAHAGFGSIAEGVSFVIRTRWLAATLLFASAIVLLVQGPIEVLLPFVVDERLGGGAGGYALLLASFGVGSVLGAALTSSVRLPRRYLSALLLVWGAGTLPLALVTFSSQLWVTAAALLVVGASYSAGAVLWGTLLQRRVPAELLGRVSSLDFFVSLAFLPVSIAIAGPVAAVVGTGIPFLAAAVVPVLLAAVILIAARLPRDELAHPLDDEAGAERATRAH